MYLTSVRAQMAISYIIAILLNCISHLDIAN